jgi:hypothetical protein
MQLKSIHDSGKDTYDVTVKVNASFSIGQNGLDLKGAIKDTMDIYAKIPRNKECNGLSFCIDRVAGIEIDGIALTEEEINAILSGDFTIASEENSEYNIIGERMKVLGISYYELFNLIHRGWSSIETGNDDGSVIEFLAIVEGTDTKPKFIHPGTPIISISPESVIELLKNNTSKTEYQGYSLPLVLLS